MKKALVLMMACALVGGAGAATYSTDFEGDAVGTLPAGWYLATPWWDGAPGPVTSEVAAAPGGGQAQKVVWGTDWASYGASSGETGYTLDIGAVDPANSTMTVSYRFYKQNWRIWQVFGDQSWFPPAGIHMNDDPNNPNAMVVGTDDYNSTDKLTNVPENTWINVSSTYNSGTGEWSTAVMWPTGGGVFGGTYATPNDIVGEYFFGGWAFQSTMDAGGGVSYDKALYNDNFAITVIPEPASLLLLALGTLALRRR